MIDPTQIALVNTSDHLQAIVRDVAASGGNESTILNINPDAINETNNNITNSQGGNITAMNPADVVFIKDENGVVSEFADEVARHLKE